MNSADIKKFADLARIEMFESNLAKTAKEIDEVLKYVGQIKDAISDDKSAVGEAESGTKNRLESASVRNVFRADKETSSRAANKEKILTSAPERKGDHIKVKKIL
ncbi:MAG TPA: Asp-tRNA(Asn)/Glu-tRNA(Gln) amidotransferase subunit GatC [Candidatus Paceibacterota bacterium]|nr:Asp-tRNA(Asn)/Glu-tRNA(Gln) amidotransferase subunit GatC [Candidatus Paceibacterota bacterium]HRZ34687.1 Asp-tRNA(Asn)/Glu-tRNA(Gln) amidotransferase subunit GatC [Candidatus Paceibacterota bacterium]